MALTPATLPLLADLAWRVTAVLAAAWLASALLRHRPAAARHRIWLAALLAALAVPAISSLVPSWPIAVLPASAGATAAVPPVPGETTPSRPPLQAVVEPDEPRAVSASSARLGEPGVEFAVPAKPMDWLGLLWAGVAAMLLGRYGASVASVAWLTRRTEPVVDRRWLDAADIAAAELNLRRSPRLLASADVAMPFTSGVLRPAVVVPWSAVADWTDERIRVVLLHEFAHVGRRDCLAQAMAQLACAAYWFNPLAWVAARRLRSERERACDDMVLEAGLRGAVYAQHLLDIARTAAPRRVLSAASLAMARPSELEGRLLAILEPRRPRSRQRWSLAGVAFALLAAPIATVSPVAQSAPAEPEAVAPAPQPSAAAPAPRPRPEPPAATVVPAPAPAPAPAPRAAQPGVAPAAARVADLAGDLAAEVVTATVTAAGVVAATIVDDVGHELRAGIRDGLKAAAAQTATPRAGAAAERTTRPVSPAVVQGLTEALKDSDADVRRQAMHALARLRVPIAFDALVAALKDEDADIRQEAAFSLGRLRDSRAIGPLSAAIKDREPDVRQQAVFALGQLRAAEAVPALRAAARDEDAEVRQQALFALAQIGQASALPTVIEALSDADEEVRQQALFAISRMGDRSAIPALTRMLASDSNAEVRQQAAFALSRLGDDSAVPALTAALKDPDPDVRRQAIHALTRIAGGDDGPPAGGVSAPKARPAPPAGPAAAQPPQPAPPPPR